MDCRVVSYYGSTGCVSWKLSKARKCRKSLHWGQKSPLRQSQCKYLVINGLHSNCRDAKKVGIIPAFDGAHMIKDDNGGSFWRCLLFWGDTAAIRNEFERPAGFA